MPNPRDRIAEALKEGFGDVAPLGPKTFEVRVERVTDCILSALDTPRQDDDSGHGAAPPPRGAAHQLSDVDALRAALVGIRDALGPLGPDEVLDQPVPAERGRRWVLSDENGLRVVKAYRLAVEALKGEGER